MRKIFRTAPALTTRIWLVTSLLMLSGVAKAAITADEIMEQSYQSVRTASLIGSMSIELVSSDGALRKRKMFVASRLDDSLGKSYRLARFTEPADVSGMASLMIENASDNNDLWIYLPNMKKVRRLLSSNEKDSFLGTDLSYGDVLGHKVQRWNHRLIDATSDACCYVVESTPKTVGTSARSGYSKMQTWVRRDNFVPERIEMWDLSGAKLKAIAMKDIVQVDTLKQKWQPMEINADNLQTGHKTHIVYENVKANAPVKDAWFSAGNLESSR
jgi:outer membrane lipoprotein-sorting protein